MSRNRSDGGRRAYDAGACRCTAAAFGGHGGGGGGFPVDGAAHGGGDTWLCNANCPATQPAAGATCSAGETCMYDSSAGAVTCTCLMGKFACN
jgi:hypothetical protein